MLSIDIGADTLRPDIRKKKGILFLEFEQNMILNQSQSQRLLLFAALSRKRVFDGGEQLFCGLALLSISKYSRHQIPDRLSEDVVAFNVMNLAPFRQRVQFQFNDQYAVRYLPDDPVLDSRRKVLAQKSKQSLELLPFGTVHFDFDRFQALSLRNVFGEENERRHNQWNKGNVGNFQRSIRRQTEYKLPVVPLSE